MRLLRIRPLVSVATLALVLVVSAGVAGASTDARARVQSSDSGSDGQVLASLSVSSAKVSVRKAGKAKFKAAADGQSLKQGDTIKTDATGTAEIDYGNDAYTRLDVNTTFTIVVLTDEQGARQVQGSLESGQTWNRTAALTESGSFEQEGAGANATVRGTAFAINCDALDHCVFTAVVDDIDLTGLDGVTQLLTPLDQCDSTDTTGEGALTGVLCGDISQISPDDLPAWILTNLLQDLIQRGIDDSGFLTGTVVVTSTGGVVFVPGPTPPLPTGGGGGGGPVVTAPQVDDPPIAVDYGAGGEAVGASDFSGTPSNSIDVIEGDSADFVVRVVPGFDGDLYVVFTKLPGAVGTVYFYLPSCDGPCAGDVDNRVYTQTEDPGARYRVDTVFYFEAEYFSGCEDFACVATVHSDDMEFYIENEGGDLRSSTAHVAVNVEENDYAPEPCAEADGEDVEAAC